MNIAEKLNKVSENTEKVFNAGKTAEWSKFWDGFQNNGKRIEYGHAFQNWPDNIFYPKYDIKVYNGTGEKVFMNCGVKNLKQRLIDCNVELLISNTSISQMFHGCQSTEYPKLDVSQTNSMSNAFYSCKAQKLEFIVAAKTTFHYGTFSSCTSLTEIYLEGELATNGLTVNNLKLTHDSLMSIINCLKDYSDNTSGTTYKVTLGSTNLAKLTNEEKAMATEKGWTLA